MKTLHILAAAAIAVTVASCSGKPELSYMPAKAEGDSNWGLVDANGEFLFTDEFSDRPSPVVNGYFFVEEGNGYTVYKAEKNPKQVGDLSGLKGCGFYNDGLMPVVHKGEHISFVDGSGKTKFTLEAIDSVSVSAAMNMFVNGRCAIRTSDEKWGAIDTDGNVVVKPKYENPVLFVEDIALVKDAQSGESYIIDRNGNTKASVSGNISSGGVFIDGYTIVQIEGPDSGEESRMAIVKGDGELTKLPSAVKYVKTWNSKYIVFESSDYEYGILSVDGDIKVRAKYDNIELLANGKFIGNRDGKYMYVSPDGDTEKLPGEVGAAVGFPYQFSKVFDFKFELVSEDDDDDELQLRTYNGKKVGKEMDRYKGRIELDNIYSDYFDYADVTRKFMDMFDADGLKGYPFDSTMKLYADTTAHTVEWYRGDTSMSVSVASGNPYFYVSSATLYSDRTIVYDATPYASYYTWEFNPASRVTAISLTLSFNGNNYRNDLPGYFAEALRDRFGITVPESSYGDNYVSSNGYDAITVHLSSWKPVPLVSEEVVAPADTTAIVFADSVK